MGARNKGRAFARAFQGEDKVEGEGAIQLREGTRYMHEMEQGFQGRCGS